MRFAAILVLGVSAISLVLASPDVLAATTGKTSAKKSKPASSGKSKSSKSSTKSAKPEPTPEPLTEAQLNAAKLVHTGRADCEFDQSLTIEPDAGRAGTFQLAFERKTYQMVAEETSTGTVRLLDQSAGVAWLQLGLKSMLMNVKAGQRMVDACTSENQRLLQAKVDAYAADQARVTAAAASAATVPAAAAISTPGSEIATVTVQPGVVPSSPAPLRPQTTNLLKN